MAKEIFVCNEHETPLIWTFAFPYAEYFCMAGNHAMGMLGAGHKVPATPELLKLQALYNRRWGQLRKHIVVSKFWRKDCPQCVGDESHNYHMTDAEQRRSDMALARLAEYAEATNG